MSSGETELQKLTAILENLKQEGGAPVTPPAGVPDPENAASSVNSGNSNGNNAVSTASSGTSGRSRTSSVNSGNSTVNANQMPNTRNEMLGELGRATSILQANLIDLSTNSTARPALAPQVPLAQPPAVQPPADQSQMPSVQPTTPAQPAPSSSAPQVPSAPPSNSNLAALGEATDVLSRNRPTGPQPGQPPQAPSAPQVPSASQTPGQPAQQPQGPQPKSWWSRFQIPKFPKGSFGKKPNSQPKPDGYQASKDFPGDPELPPILNMLEEYIVIIPENEAYLSQKDFNNLNVGNCWSELPRLFGIDRNQFKEKLPILQRYFGVWHKPYLWSNGRPKPAIFEDPMCYPGDAETKTFIQKVFTTRIQTLKNEINTMQGSGITADNLHIKRKTLQIERIQVFLRSLGALQDTGDNYCEPIPQVKFGFYVPDALKGMFKRKCDCMKELKQLTDLVLITMTLLTAADQEKVKTRLRQLNIASLLLDEGRKIIPEDLNRIEAELRKLLKEIQDAAPGVGTQRLQQIARQTNTLAEAARENGVGAVAQTGGALNQQLNNVQTMIQNVQTQLAAAVQSSAKLSKEDREKVKAFLDAYKPLKGTQFKLPLSEADRTKIKSLLEAHKELQSVEGYEGQDIGQETLQKLLDFAIGETTSASLQRSNESYDIEDKLNQQLEGVVGEEEGEGQNDDKEMLEQVKELEKTNFTTPFSPEMEQDVKVVLGLEGNAAFKNHIEQQSLEKVKELSAKNSDLKTLQDFKVPDVGVEALEAAVAEEGTEGPSVSDLKTELTALNAKKGQLEEELSDVPSAPLPAPTVIPGASEEDQALNEIAGNLNTIKANYNPFNEVLALLSIDKGLTDKIRAYLGNPTQEGLTAIEDVLEEDEKEAENVLKYLRILLSYQLDALLSLDIDTAIKEDILSVFTFTEERDTEKELRELLNLFEQLFVQGGGDTKKLLSPEIVPGRESVIVGAVDENPYLKKLLESRQLDSSRVYLGAKESEDFVNEFIPFMEDKDNALAYVVAYVQDGSLKLRRTHDWTAVEEEWKRAKGVPLNFLIVRFLQLLKQKFQ